MKREKQSTHSYTFRPHGTLYTVDYCINVAICHQIGRHSNYVAQNINNFTFTLLTGTKTQTNLSVMRKWNIRNAMMIPICNAPMCCVALWPNVRIQFII